MTKHKLWVISELFHPVDTSTSFIMTRIADYMSDYFNVHVLTGPAKYDTLDVKNDDKSDRFEFEIHRVNVGNFDKNRLVSRILRLSCISLAFCWFILRRIKRHEKAFIVTNPAFFIVVAALLKRFKKYKLYILVHDVFPENLIPSRILKRKGPLYTIIKFFFDWAYNQADELIVLGIDMKRVLLAKTTHLDKNIHIVQNWAELEKITPLSQLENQIIQSRGLKDKVVLTFAGNIGRLQGVDLLVKLINAVENEKVHFLFVGDGALAAEIQNLSEVTTQVTYLGKLPRAQQNTFLNAGSIGIVSLSDQMTGLGVPSKSYNILAAGRPILFIGDKDTEIAIMIESNNLGWVFYPSQVTEITGFLNSLSKDHYLLNLESRKRIRNFAEQYCSEKQMMEKLKIIIEK